jgi:hypothetical protein
VTALPFTSTVGVEGHLKSPNSAMIVFTAPAAPSPLAEFSKIAADPVVTKEEAMVSVTPTLSGLFDAPGAVIAKLAL